MNSHFVYRQERLRHHFEQNGSYFSHSEPTVNANEVQSSQQTVDTDMPEQHESEEATIVDGHVAQDMQSESNMDDVTMVDGSDGVPNGNSTP